MMTKPKNNRITRRCLLRVAGSAAVASAFPMVVPSAVLGKRAPSNRINIGMIGVGRQAMYANLPPFLHSEDARVVAVCDVDS